MAIPYGSSDKRTPGKIRTFGSWAARPCRMVSSVLMASTWPCWSITRQSVWFVTDINLGGGGRAARLVSEVDPDAAQTVLPARSAVDLIDDPLGTRMACPAS